MIWDTSSITVRMKGLGMLLSSTLNGSLRRLVMSWKISKQRGHLQAGS